MNTQSPTNRSMPPGIIIPELVYRDLGEAVAWLCTRFGFKERLRIGNHRVQLTLGDTSMVAIGRPDLLAAHGEPTHSLMVSVDDVDKHYQHVYACGTQILNPPTDHPYGERQYTVEDPGGHRWTFSQSIADVDPSEWGGKLISA